MVNKSFAKKAVPLHTKSKNNKQYEYDYGELSY